MELQNYLNPTLLISSVTLLIIYHVVVHFQYRRNPLRTNFGMTLSERTRWAEIYIRKADIIAVQTLRNWIMTSTFMASSAILLSLGTLNALLSIESITLSHAQLNIFGHLPPVHWKVYVFLLLIIYLVAFFCFSLTLRYYNRASFQVGIESEADVENRRKALALTLNRGAILFRFGMRAYHISIPIILGLFGAIWTFFSMLILIWVLYRLDFDV